MYQREHCTLSLLGLPRRRRRIAAANEARIAPNDVSVIGADKAYAKPTLKPISAEAD